MSAWQAAFHSLEQSVLTDRKHHREDLFEGGCDLKFALLLSNYKKPNTSSPACVCTGVKSMTKRGLLTLRCPRKTPLLHAQLCDVYHYNLTSLEMTEPTACIPAWLEGGGSSTAQQWTEGLPP